ncbi:hypothetical protein DD556_17685 [Phaeobacter sp. JL2872]|nr:hypothetical protein DD556_17685 [Phaeobacter sp. JL2872]
MAGMWLDLSVLSGIDEVSRSAIFEALRIALLGPHFFQSLSFMLQPMRFLHCWKCRPQGAEPLGTYLGLSS